MYITLEGIDGCGTTTQVDLLVKELVHKGFYARSTKEPTDKAIGKMVREYLKPRRFVNEEVHALLFAADRLEHDIQTQNQLRQGITMIGDRGLGSSFVYQGLTCGEEFTKAINQKAMVPGLTIVIRVTVMTAMARLINRGVMDRFENETFLTKVFEGYNKLPKQMDNVVFVNGEQSIEDVTKACLDQISNIDLNLF